MTLQHKLEKTLQTANLQVEMCRPALLNNK